MRAEITVCWLIDSCDGVFAWVSRIERVPSSDYGKWCNAIADTRSTIGKTISRKPLQKKTPNGHTILTITFELSSSERVNFKKACGNAINADLPIQITVGTSGARFKVKKPGKGAKAYENNSIKIARFVSENFEFAHIPAIRPGQMSLEVISNLLERELAVSSRRSAVQGLHEYNRAIRTAGV